jgi:hypothetical protein
MDDVPNVRGKAIKLGEENIEVNHLLRFGNEFLTSKA